MKKLVGTFVLMVGALALSGDTGYTRFEKKLPKTEQILHALDRLGFGPRTGDVEAVQKMGLKKWIDLQLHPDRIAENPILEDKLKPLDSLTMTPAEAISAYPPPQLLRAIAAGRQAYPNNPLIKAAIERAAQRLKLKAGDELERPAKPLADLLTQAQIKTLRTGTNEQKSEILNSLPEDRVDDVIMALPGGLRQQLMVGADPNLRRKIEIASNPGQVIPFDLTEAKLYRAVYSNRQLQEQMVDFWFNHFNVTIEKGAVRFLASAYERDAIRPHVFGKFRDLLEATASSPAMLFYLDNWQSVDPGAVTRLRAKAKQANRGLNENYARELMELHTLGVDGGYTQKDVTEVARCFTGWTILQPNLGGEFNYNDRVHDKGEKTVLGVTIPAGGGRKDAEEVLDILAKHPSTARFISTKLAQKFVADNPPPALIERMARAFRDTDGDIRAVLTVMIESKEFFSEGAWRAKVKTPFEMMVSAVRATGADLNYAVPLANQIAQLGQPLYRKLEPTGYSSANAEWVNSAALLGRMNFALSLAANRVPGVTLDQARFSHDPAEVGLQLLFRAPSKQTLASIAMALQQQNEPNAVPLTMAGLILGSPDFQRR